MSDSPLSSASTVASSQGFSAPLQQQYQKESAQHADERARHRKPKRQVIPEPRTHFDAHAISSFSPGMQAAFITCVSPRPRLCRRPSGEELGLRISTPAIASRRAAAVNSRNTSATPAPIKGNAALGMKSAALLIENLLRCNGKPRATQSFIPPSTGTAFTQPADRRIPVARLARA